MNRYPWRLVLCLVISGCLITLTNHTRADEPATEPAATQADDPAATQVEDSDAAPAATQADESTSVPADTQADDPIVVPVVTKTDDPTAPLREEAAAAYEALAEAYLSNDWDSVEKLRRSIRKHMRFLDRQQRMDVAYIQKNIKDFQPKWWGKCSSSSNISFKAAIWNRPLMANYMPTQMLGAQSVRAKGQIRVDRRGRVERTITGLDVIVTWKPSMVNSSTPGTGKLAEVHDMKLGELGEVIVWHELGHCYITNYLPMEHVVELYEQHAMLFSHLQEFYADLTAIQHASPKARRIAMILRLEGLDRYDDAEQHARASHAIGSMILFEALENPDDWPSLHFPPSIPSQQVELNTIIYLYEYMDPNWSVKEARALREMAGDFIKRYGEKTLRSKGMVTLPAKYKFSLMAGQDHEHQTGRDAYVAQKLKALIDSGRADTLTEDETYDPPLRRKLREGEEYIRTPDDRRIDIPF